MPLLDQAPGITARFTAVPPPQEEALSDPVMASYDTRSTLTKLSQSFERGRAIVEQGELGNEIRAWGDSEERKARLDAVKGRLEALGEAGGGFTGLLEQSTEVVGQMIASATTPKAQAATAAGAAFGSVLPGVGTVAGAGIGMTAAMLMSAYEGMASETYMTQREAGIDPTTAYWTSAGVGVLGAALEGVSLSVLAAPVRDLFKQGIQRAATDKRVLAALAKGGKAYGAALAAEVTTEGLQEAAAIAGEELSKMIAEGDFTSITEDEAYERIVGVMGKTLKGMVLLGASGGIAAARTTDLQRNRQAIANGDKQKALQEAVDALPPEQKRDVLDTALADSKDEGRWLDADTLVELAKDNPALYQAVGVSPDAAQEAAFLGGDIRINQSALREIMLTDLAPVLQDHLRVEADAPSVAEAKAQVETLKAEIDTVEDTGETNEDLYDAENPPVGQVEPFLDAEGQPDSTYKIFNTPDVPVDQSSSEVDKPSTVLKRPGIVFQEIDFATYGMPERGRVVKINSSFITEAERGQGKGTKLYEDFIQWAKAQGYTQVLSDSKLTEGAYKTYERLGKRGFKVSLNDVVEGENRVYKQDERYFHDDGDPIFTIDLSQVPSTKPPEPTQAQAEMGLQAFFTDANHAGMTDLQYERYLVKLQKAADSRNNAKERTRLSRELRETQGALKAAKDALRETATQTVTSQPAYQAINGIGRERLDRDQIVALLGEGALAQLPKQGGRQIFAKGGMDLDLYADMMGFDSPDLLLFAMMDAVPQEQAIEAEVDRLFNERHRGIAQRELELQEEIQALHNDDQAQVLAMELNQLRESVKQKRLKPRVVKVAARDKLRDMKLAEIKPQQFLIAEARAARKAAQLLRKGDRAGAARAKFQQLVNFEMAREAYRVTARAQRQKKYFQKFLKRPKKGAALPNSYLQIIRRLLGEAGQAPVVAPSLEVDPRLERTIANTTGGEAADRVIDSSADIGPIRSDTFGIGHLRRADGFHHESSVRSLPNYYKPIDNLFKELSARFGIKPPMLWIGTSLSDYGQANGYATTDWENGHVVLVDDMSVTQALHTALHEFGHHLDFQLFENAPAGVKKEIKRAWVDAVATSHGMTIEQTRPLTAFFTEGKDQVADENSFEYMWEFREWFAEQVVQWITTNRQPTNSVEMFFKRAAEFWRAIYAKVIGRIPQSEEVANFLRANWNKATPETLARARFGQPKTTTAPALSSLFDRKTNVVEVLKEFEQSEGVSLIIPLEVRETLSGRYYLDLTLREWENLHDAVKTVEKAGLDENRFLRQAERATRDEVAAEVAANVVANIKSRAGRDNETRLAKMAKVGRGFRLLLLTPDTILRSIDGGMLGAAYRAIKQPYDRAISSGYLPGSKGYNQRLRDEMEELNKLHAIYDKSEQVNMGRKNITVPGVGKISRERLLSVMLNLGNIENRQALIASGEFTEDTLAAIVDAASAKDVQFVQGVWDYLERFWPEVKDSSVRRRNVEPPKVAPTPLDTKFGTLRGGYYPISYDGDERVLTQLGQTEDVDELIARLRHGTFTSMMTAHGHTLARTRANGAPIKLNLGVLQGHIQQVTYDLEVGDALIDSYKIINHKAVREAFMGIGRKQHWDQLNLWFGDVVMGERNHGNETETAMRYIRTGMAVSKLGFSLTTAALQLTGVAQSAVALGKVNVFRGTLQAMNPFIYNRVATQSDFMRQRQQSFNREITEAQQALKGGLLRRITPGESARFIGELAFYGIIKLQSVVDTATWLAAQRQGMKKFGTTEESIAYADRMISQTQSSGILGDRSSWQRGTVATGVRQNEIVRTITPFIGYFLAKTNVAYNRTRDTNFRNPFAVVDLAVDLMLLYMVDAMAAAWLYGQLPDDDEDWPFFLAQQTVLSVLGGIPFLRDVAAAAEGFDPGGTMASVEGEAGKFVVQAGQFFREGEQQGVIDQAMVKSAARLTGTLLHVPGMSQMVRTGEGAYRMWDGEDVALMELLFGPGWREE